MARVDISSEKITDLTTRGVAEVVVRDSVVKKLKSGKPLRVKHGVDPTTTDLHLGYGVVYLKLRELQDMGHTVILLIGDFTGRFGDPTEQQEARTLRTKKEVQEIAKDYLDQAGLILDRQRLEIRRNGEWYDKMSAEELLRLMSRFTTDQLLERDMFVERKKAGKPIFSHEIVYPVLQAYDSVMLKSDLTVVGTDQLFNEARGRDLQRYFNQEPQDIIATELLVGTDGQRKMSQSLGNHIAFRDPPLEKFGKVMSIPDNLVVHYYTLATRIGLAKIREVETALKSGSLHPRDAKLDLAETIVSLYHSTEEAKKVREEFVRVFSDGELPRDLPTIVIKKTKVALVALLVEAKLAPSKSEARRLVGGGAVEVDGVVKSDPDEIIDLKKPLVLRVGKKRFARIVLK